MSQDLTNEEILTEDPNSQAVEAEEGSYYDPNPDEDSGVVVIEPEIIAIGRGKRKHALRSVPEEQR